MKSISKQLITISIILLLVGVSYTSAIRVENKIPIIDAQFEEDCGCNKISDDDIFKLEKQLDRLERYTNLLLVVTKDKPEAREKLQVVSNRISTITNLKLINDIDNGLICLFLISYYLSFLLFAVVTGVVLGEIYHSMPIFSFVITTIFDIGMLIFYEVNYLLWEYECLPNPYPWILQIETISLLEFRHLKPLYPNI